MLFWLQPLKSEQQSDEYLAKNPQGLLPALESEELIENCVHLNMKDEIDQYNSFNLLTYSNFEINESIYRAKRSKQYA